LIMRYPGRKLVRRVLRPLARRFFPGAIVLGYHRVADDPWDPLGLQVKLGYFTAQLAELQRLRTVICLQALVQRQAAGEPLDRYAVVTFDDGYSDFAETVVPIATRAGAPVTVFVPSGCTGRQFWWEELAALLRPGGWGEPVLDLSLGASEPMHFIRMEQPDARAEAAHAIAMRLSCADRATVNSVLEQLQLWVGRDDRPSRAAVPMSAATLAEAARSPNVEIGGHTVSHCCLKQLGLDDQRREIEQNKTELETLCGVPVSVFSYPNGSFSSETPRVAAGLGYSCACTSREGTFSKHTDPYQIPRIWAPDLPGPGFRKWLGNWVAEACA
jgi:peptidoglycan/xylan/chitin deacetylase (PgdA/CDA1 family)